MKNQYFGDVHDLFKYDLALEILTTLTLSKFTFLPMLTPNEPNNEGKRIKYSEKRAGYHRILLRTFLERCLEENRRNVNELYKFFNDEQVIHSIGKKIELYIHHADENGYFTHQARSSYFESIPRYWLTDAVILVDPDVGIEVKSASRKQMHKYVTYKEIQWLHERMNDRSILIVFQYIPRTNRQQFYEKKCLALLENVKSSKLHLQYISDNQVVFFVMTKTTNLQMQLERTLKNYASSYQLHHGVNVR